MGQNHLTVGIFNPDITVGTSYTPRGFQAYDNPLPVGEYHQVLSSLFGFDNAALTFLITKDQVDDWIRRGLNRHIEVYGPHTSEIFSGFVNRISVQAGRKTIQQGPLMEAYNRVSAVYTRLFTDVSPAVSGGKWVTTIAQDTAIQKEHGVIEKVLSLGETTFDRAEDIRDLFLAEHKRPLPFEEVAFEGGAPFQVRLEILGYMHKLKAYIYEDLTNYTVQLDTRIQDVFEADPNFLWGAGADYSGIATNNILVPAQEDLERPAIDVIKWLLSHGDASGNSYAMGVYRQQKIRYQQVQDEVFYVYNTTEPAANIFTRGLDLVYPWDIRPGKWMLFADYLPGQNFPTTDPRVDPRAVLINQVEYTAPYGLRVNGRKVSELSQRLVQWGLGTAV